MKFRALAVVVACACACALASCQSAPSQSSVPSSSAVDLASLVSHLGTSLSERDQNGFLANFAPSAQSQQLGQIWYANLSQFAHATISSAHGGVTVSWSVPGDRAPVVDTLDPDLSLEAGRTVIVGNPLNAATPVWAATNVTVDTSAAGSVVSAALTSAQRTTWQSRLASAVRRLGDADLAPLDDSWNGRLVVQIPADADGYRRLGGDPDTSEAVTVCRAGAVRIDVNPRALALGAGELDTLLLHEGVHAATQSCASATPMWQREGLAEWVAASAYPATASSDRAAAVAWLASHPFPSALPPDADFAGDGDATWAAYALSELAVGAMVHHLGRPATMRMLNQSRLTDAQLARATGWYQDALRALAGKP